MIAGFAKRRAGSRRSWNKKTSYGFKAATEEYGDMLSAGIIDPTKVARTALQNAASIAGLMITTECLVADKPEEKKMPGGMGGGDRYWKTGIETPPFSLSWAKVSLLTARD